MKRTSNFRPRQLPHCAWCFAEIDNPRKKFCTEYCADAAREWKLAEHLRKMGQEIAKKDVQKHYERNITDDFDNEYPI